MDKKTQEFVLWIISILTISIVCGILIVKLFESNTEKNNIRLSKIEACKSNYSDPTALTLCLKQF